LRVRQVKEFLMFNYYTSRFATDTCCVFLVEDDRDDQLLAKRTLKGHRQIEEVKCFVSGGELITYLGDHGYFDHTVMCLTPIVVVIDLNMPGVNGFEILKDLKSDRFLEDIPVVVVSGTLTDEATRRATELGADAVFPKPLRAEMLSGFLDVAWRWPTREMLIA
jgi:CheY-like chemotaxis protein